jgi:hypothetical protein
MSQHHRAQKWSTHSPKLRKLHAAMLPQPCVECGQLVTRQDSWQVGHRRDAGDGGAPTFANTGPVHRKSAHWPRNCNQIAGGKRGAAKTNATKRRDANSPDIRPW